MLPLPAYERSEGKDRLERARITRQNEQERRRQRRESRMTKMIQYIIETISKIKLHTIIAGLAVILILGGGIYRDRSWSHQSSVLKNRYSEPLNHFYFAFCARCPPFLTHFTPQSAVLCCWITHRKLHFYFSYSYFHPISPSSYFPP